MKRGEGVIKNIQGFKDTTPKLIIRKNSIFCCQPTKYKARKSNAHQQSFSWLFGKIFIYS
jgi:hypothetical protein